jgi:formylglycine-generating enzyme required for sulfatase activity
VNWWESYAFCIWDGGFLPSQAEWEYAAAGGSQQREYPWGSTDPGTMNQYAIYNCYYPSGSSDCLFLGGANGSRPFNIAPVGYAALGGGLWGQLDLSGEVCQWALDCGPPAGTYVEPCVDCADLSLSAADVLYGPIQRVTQGGDFEYNASGTGFAYTSPKARAADLGFRCARTP